jgi:methyl-accepting chemotaxis protein
VETINTVTRESSQGAGQMAQAAATLSQQSERLQGLVGRFKL